MQIVEQIFDRARSKRARVVMPEMSEPRIAAAVDRIRSEGLAEVVPVANNPPDAAEIAAVMAQRPKVSESMAARMLSRPIFRAGAMLATGQADALVAGAETATKRVIEAVSMTVGLAEDVSLPSSFFLMLFCQRARHQRLMIVTLHWQPLLHLVLSLMRPENTNATCPAHVPDLGFLHSHI